MPLCHKYAIRAHRPCYLSVVLGVTDKQRLDILLLSQPFYRDILFRIGVDIVKSEHSIKIPAYPKLLYLPQKHISLGRREQYLRNIFLFKIFEKLKRVRTKS